MRNGITVVVSYNSAAELPACLDSIHAQRGVSLDVHVVDNASRDGSAELVRSRFPWVRLTANAVNVGFARANNQVLEAERPDYFVVLNPDTVLSPGAIAACVDKLEREEHVGIVATRLANPDGSLQPSCHAFLGLVNLVGETFLLDRLFPRWHSVSSLHMRDFPHDRERDVDWIQGAFLVVRGALCAEIGGFDPDFFMYGEEMDWCYRARRAGWRVAFLPGPPVEHIGGASSRPIAGAMFVETLKGRLRFLSKHRGPLVVLAARGVLATSVFLRWIAREAAALARAAAGMPVQDGARLRLRMFRAAMGWVLRGMPLSPPSLVGQAA